MITSLKIKNLKLFKSADVTFDKINLIKGINVDDSAQSSNGSGKSTILQAIVFGLYGEGLGNNLADLVSLGEKTTEVMLTIDELQLKRTIPTSLAIWYHQKEVQLNTNTLKQNFLNERIGDFEFFKKYRLLNKQSVNLLDLGITSLRKEMMSLIDNLFASIRQSLLAQKLERESKNVDKRLYQFHLSSKRLDALEQGLKLRTNQLLIARQDLKTQNTVLRDLTSAINTQKSLAQNKSDAYKKLCTGICPMLSTECPILKDKSLEAAETYETEQKQIEKEIQQLEDKLNIENEGYEYFEKVCNFAVTQQYQTQMTLLKLQEAFKFADYKYTAKDVELYASAIKVLDSFAGWYIQTWLDNLTVIINSLLKDVNLSVTFSADKQFMTIINEEQSMKYEQLSSGQQTFLNIVFKLAALLNNEITSGVIIIDEGVGNLDIINLRKLINIFRSLNYQVFLVYQNLENIEDVKLINIERKQNVSKIC